MGSSVSLESKNLLKQKEIFKSSLYSDSYRHLHPTDFSKVQLGLSFAQDKDKFEVYLRGSLYKQAAKLKISETESYTKAHEAFYDSLTKEEKTLLRSEHKVMMQVLGIRGMYANEEDIAEIE